MTPTSARTRRHLSASPFNTPPETPPIESFAVPDRVSHDKYGLGRVIALEENVAVLVQFGSGQVRIASPYRKLTKL